MFSIFIVTFLPLFLYISVYFLSIIYIVVLVLHFYCHITPPISVYFLFFIYYIVVLVLHFYCHIPPPISVYFCIFFIYYIYSCTCSPFLLSHSSPYFCIFFIYYIVVLVLHFYCHIPPPISVYFCIFFIYYIYSCTCSPFLLSHSSPYFCIFFIFYLLYSCTCSHLEYVWYICCLMLCNQKPINRLRIAQLIATL